MTPPMRLGIMQPYFFPYAGYFDLIRKTDAWIVFDVVAYRPKTWMNRNRILDPNGQSQYVGAPVDRKSGKLISEICLTDVPRTRDKILRQLEVYRGSAPHYQAVRDCVEGAFARFEGESLRDLNVATLAAACDHLGIDFAPRICSALDLDFSGVDHPGAWALEICRQLGAPAYLNPPGGVDIFRPAEWSANGIDLAFTTMPDLVYDVGRKFEFLPNASILDVMMWNEPDRILAHLDSLPIVPHPDA